MTEQEILGIITSAKSGWSARQTKFKDWHDTLRLTDRLKSKKMESVVSNEPRTFYNLAHFMLTAGRIKHSVAVDADNPADLEKQARCARACRYIWTSIDNDRMLHGRNAFLDDLSYHMLVYGWYSALIGHDPDYGDIPFFAELWNPVQVFPLYEDGGISYIVHTYAIDIAAAKRKAERNGWTYAPQSRVGTVTIDNFFFRDRDVLMNAVLIDGKMVTPLIARPNLKLLVGPVGGFSDMGVFSGDTQWTGYLGQSILEPNQTTYHVYNKQMSFMMQILRDIAQPKWQEHSVGAPKVKPDQLTERGAVLHFNPNEGIDAIYPAPVPMELRAMLMDLRTELQKGSFSDVLHGIIQQGTSGYTISQIVQQATHMLSPYQKAKHFIVSQADQFFLENLRGKSFVFKGRFNEELASDDIPENPHVEVSSELATAKDWMSKATVANMLSNHVDETTILDEILNIDDTELIRRRKEQDLITQHPMSQNLLLIAAYDTYAEYLDWRGNTQQAEVFRTAAEGLRQQLSVPPAGAAKPTEYSQAEAARQASAPARKPKKPSSVAPPEETGIQPAELRSLLGKGSM